MAKKVLIGTFSFQTFTECVWIKEEYIKTDWECGVRGLDSAGLEAQRLYKWVFNSSQTFSRSEAENKFRPIWSLFFLSLLFFFPFVAQYFCSVYWLMLIFLAIFLLQMINLLIHSVFCSFLNFNLFFFNSLPSLQ